MAKAKTATIIVKKKRWIPVQASPEFGNQRIGEIYLEESTAGIGRILDVSLMSITGDPSRQSIYIQFKINKEENNTLHTDVIGYRIITAAVRKMMHKGRNKLEDSFVIITKDSKKLRIKPIFITKGKITGSIHARLRRESRAHIIRTTAERTYSDLIKELTTHQFQKQLQQALRKIYPISTCEIKRLSLEPEGKLTIADVPAETPAEEEDYTETEHSEAEQTEQPLEPPLEPPAEEATT